MRDSDELVSVKLVLVALRLDVVSVRLVDEVRDSVELVSVKLVDDVAVSLEVVSEKLEVVSLSDVEVSDSDVCGRVGQGRGNGQIWSRSEYAGFPQRAPTTYRCRWRKGGRRN